MIGLGLKHQKIIKSTLTMGGYQTRGDLEKVAPGFFTSLTDKGFKSSQIHFPVNGRSLVKGKYEKVYKILEQDGFLGVTYYTDIDEYFNEILRLIEEKKK